MINYVLDIFIIISLFGFFGYIHSLLASSKFKKKIVKKFGSKIAFYRLFYNIFSLLLFYLLYQLMPKPNLIIFDLSPPWDLIMLIPQLIALAGIFWCLKYICAKEFIGIEQVKRWMRGSYNTEELDENLTLRIEGPYKFTRHPVYFFSIIFLAARPIMDLFYFTLLVCIIGYFYIGSVYEEKKLIDKFGNDYIKYRETIPRIIPLKIFQPYKSEFK